MVFCVGRLFGDFIYLDVIIVEGKNFCIIAYIRGFYVNCSKGNILNAEFAILVIEFIMFVGLFWLLSKKFVLGKN